MKKTFLALYILMSMAAVSLLVYSCTKPGITSTSTPPPPIPSSAKDVTSFEFKVANNPTLTGDIAGTITTDSILITVPFGTVVNGLIPSISITGVSIAPLSLGKQDFTKVVTYIVKAADSSTKSYSVVVKISAEEATLFISSIYAGANPKGKLYAIDANTGLLKWEILENAGSFGSSPSFFNGFIYIGLGYNVACIDTATKNLKWQFITGNYVQSTPTIVNGIVYINSDDQYLYALDAATGSLIWKYKEGPPPSASAAGNLSSPTVVNGVVYVGSFDGNIYAFDAMTGSLKWKTYDSYNNGYEIQSSPSVVNNVLYSGSTSQSLVALNANDGSLKWTFSPLLGSYSSPTVVGGIVYIGSDTQLYAIDAISGSLIWKYYTPLQIAASPTVANGIVYVGNISPGYANMYAIDALNGTLKWSYSNPDEFASSPVAFNGTVYVGSYASVMAFDSRTGSLKWKFDTDDNLEDVRTSPCIVDKKGNIFSSSISGSQN